MAEESVRNPGTADRASVRVRYLQEVRALTSLGRKEAKDLVDSAPKPVLEKVPKEVAEKAKVLIEGAGGTVELKLGSGRPGGRPLPLSSPIGPSTRRRPDR